MSQGINYSFRLCTNAHVFAGSSVVTHCPVCKVDTISTNPIPFFTPRTMNLGLNAGREAIERGLDREKFKKIKISQERINAYINGDPELGIEREKNTMLRNFFRAIKDLPINEGIAAWNLFLGYNPVDETEKETPTEEPKESE